MSKNEQEIVDNKPVGKALYVAMTKREWDEFMAFKAKHPAIKWGRVFGRHLFNLTDASSKFMDSGDAKVLRKLRTMGNS